MDVATAISASIPSFLAHNKLGTNMIAVHFVNAPGISKLWKELN